MSDTGDTGVIRQVKRKPRVSDVHCAQQVSSKNWPCQSFCDILMRSDEVEGSVRDVGAAVLRNHRTGKELVLPVRFCPQFSNSATSPVP